MQPSQEQKRQLAADPLISKKTQEMAIYSEEQQLRDRFFKVLLEATLPLEPGPDCSSWSIGIPQTTLSFPPGPRHEIIVEKLIDAGQMLKEHLDPF